MKVNILEFLKNLRGDKLLKVFKIKDIVLHNGWLPVCKYYLSETPKNTYLEEYSSNVYTWGALKKIARLRLRFKNKTLYNNWKFPFIPLEFKIKGDILFAKLPKNYIALQFIRKTNRIDAICLPEKIEFQAMDFVALGLLQGEMITSIRGKSRQYISFVNSDYRLINIVLAFFEKLNIKKDVLSAQIFVNTKNAKPHSDAYYITYWLNKLGIPKKQFTKIDYRKDKKTSKNFGTVSVKYHSTFFRLFLQYLLNRFKETAEADKDFSIPYLKGLFSAEGNVNLSPSNSLNFLCIGGSKDAKHYRSVLNTIGVSAGGLIRAVSNEEGRKRGWQKGTGGFLMIQGWKNFKIFYSENLLELSADKMLRFLYGLKYHKKAKKDAMYLDILKSLDKLKKNYKNSYALLLKQRNKLTKNELNVIKILKQKKTITTKELSKKLSIRRGSTSRILNSIYRKGQVKKLRDNGRLFWRL